MSVVSELIKRLVLAVAVLFATDVSAKEAAQYFHFLALFPPASHPQWEGVARIINRSDESGSVHITGIDDAGNEFGPVELSLEALATAHFNSSELEDGSPENGLLQGLGDGEGDWRLHLESDVDIDPLAYVRTEDGFVAAMHDVVQEEEMRHHVRYFNPRSSQSQASRLRLINMTEESVEVTIVGLDDNGNPAPGGEVRLALGSREGRTLTAEALESGGDGLSGSLGDGQGKWQLFVSADGPIRVVSLLRSPTGHLANLSTGGPPPTDGLWRADRSIVKYLTGPVDQGKSPGLLAAIVGEEGVRAIAVAGVRRQGSSQELTVNDLIHIGSNTKAMTSTMLATLVADGTLARGWQTTIGDVFPELLFEIHPGYHSVSLRQLITMTGGVMPDAANWWAHAEIDIVETRYRLLRENLKSSPARPAGAFLYSNLAYMVAGAMAERVTEKSWEALMDERLFTPLGMTSAGFGTPGTPNRVDQPWGHRRDSARRWIPGQFDNAPALGPAGTVHLSIEDWAKFIRLWFLDSEPAILSRSVLNGLASPDSGDYAAGWFRYIRSWAGGVTLHHKGSNTYWNTDLWLSPSKGVAYLAAANSYDESSTPLTLDSIIGRGLLNHVP